MKLGGTQPQQEFKGRGSHKEHGCSMVSRVTGVVIQLDAGCYVTSGRNRFHMRREKLGLCTLLGQLPIWAQEGQATFCLSR